MGQTIYYVEDDPAIAGSVTEYLSGRGFTVLTAGTAARAKELLSKRLPSLLLVDWNLPDENGDRLCRWARSCFPKLPVIFLTVKGDTRDIVQGFERGADDYIVKPFEPEILITRIEALLRRAGDSGKQQEWLSCGSITLNRASCQVFKENREIALGAVEYQILRLLMEQKNKTVLRQQLLEHIWDANGNFVNDNTLTVTIKRLREKLGKPDCIRTIRSFGYQMEERE